MSAYLFSPMVLHRDNALTSAGTINCLRIISENGTHLALAASNFNKTRSCGQLAERVNLPTK